MSETNVINKCQTRLSSELFTTTKKSFLDKANLLEKRSIYCHDYGQCHTLHTIYEVVSHGINKLMITLVICSRYSG